MDTSVFDIPHDGTNHLTIALVTFAEIIENSRTNHCLRGYERHEKFASECKVEQILRGVQLYRLEVGRGRRRYSECEISC